MRLVILESPYAGDIERHEAYGRLCMRDCLVNKGEAPFASHLLYTQKGVLKDGIAAERELGMAAGFAWGLKADATVVYTDMSMSRGMEEGIRRAKAAGRPVEYRKLPADLWEEFVEVFNGLFK